ncbi:MAG: hypothetical protein BHW65_02620 [Verrucomicrobia bacterium CAG:312_58_20]|nr:MAG: hypothetical protein BHW65_02620 [Verrucomicrobia bacterium CAG:312_58_20]
MKFPKAILAALAVSAFFLFGCNSDTAGQHEAPRELVGFLKYTGSTYSPFRSTAPYKYCIYDIDGDFVAYADTTRLITSNIERYFGKLVVLRGSLAKIDGDPVVRVENIKFR